MRPKPYFAPPFRPPLAGEDARARTLDIIGHRQVRNYTCGYASALTVLRYFRPEVRARELFERLGTGRDGTRQGAIIRELRDAGLSANARYDFDLARLVTAIDRGKLVIAYYYPAEHWVVLYGYGREPDRVFVADSRAGEPCEQPWDEYGATLRGFGIVVSDRGPSAARSAGADAEPAPATRSPILLPASSIATSPAAQKPARSPAAQKPARSPGAQAPARLDADQLAFDF